MTTWTTPRRIAVIGGGFTGSMLSAHLLRLSETPTTIHLIERATPGPGRGIAYATPCGAHRLNVRAYNMSAFPDDPRHFLRWLWARDSGDAVPPSGHAFVSRACYGRYIQDVLAEARMAAPPHVHLTIQRGEAIGLTHAGEDVRVRFADGTALVADMAVLCVGNFPPSPPRLPFGEDDAVFASDRFVGDPWDHTAIDSIPTDDGVLVLGTGLTMVDVVLSLLDNGHRGPITAVSRRGLLPLVHCETRPYTSFLRPEVMPRTVLDVLIALKADARRAVEDGYDWRSAFDALRPYHHRIWQHLSMEERRRFLRHARPFWEVHRHRMAPEVAARIDAARMSGQLEIRAGRIRAMTATASGIDTLLRVRGGARTVTIPAGHVINATGTECDYQRIRHPLIRALLRGGLARPDPLRLGLDVTEEGAVIGADGAASDRLLALGPVSRAPFWEMTAVPELRSQCSSAAARIAAMASPGGAGRTAFARIQRDAGAPPVE